MSLLPCPFCGSPALPCEEPSYSNGRVTFSIGCSQEGCFAYDMVGAPYPRRSEAAEAWNKRVGLGTFHLSSGGKPDEPVYTRRDVEALIGVALAVANHRKADNASGTPT